MTRVYEALKPGGYFLFTVPNVNALGVSLRGAAWQCFILPDHLNYFSCGTAHQLLQRFDFEPVLIYSEPSITLGLRKQLYRLNNVPLLGRVIPFLHYHLGAFKRDYFYPWLNMWYQKSGWDANNLVVLARKPKN